MGAVADRTKWRGEKDRCRQAEPEMRRVSSSCGTLCVTDGTDLILMMRRKSKSPLILLEKEIEGNERRQRTKEISYSHTAWTDP
jgi:hypothetical protein